jgi:hypothetical protein
MADRVTLLLIGGYIGALALGAYELQRVPSVPRGVSGQTAESLPPLEIPPDAIKNIEAFDAIVERPLFNRGRQPLASIQGPVEPQPAVRSQKTERMRLTAVLKEADNLTALVEDQSGQTMTLHQGDKLGEWQVSEILDDRIVIESEGKTKTLEVHQFDPVNTRRSARQRLPVTKRRQVTQRPSAVIAPRAPSSTRRSDQIPVKP